MYQSNPQARPRGAGFAVTAFVLGLVGLVFPFLPFDLHGERGLLGLPFGVLGIVLAIIGCTGQRRAKPLAIVAVVLCALVLAIALVMLGGVYHYSG
jgi:hypothetical protein